MNIKPVRDFVAVVKEQQQNKTSGGIYVPDAVEEKFLTGKVVAVGSGHVKSNGDVVPMEVSVGDRVVFARESGVDLKVDDHQVVVLREDAIVCRLVG